MPTGDKLVNLNGLKTVYDKVQDDISDVVLVQNSQPVSEANKLWISSENEQEVQIPTYEEYSNLKTECDNASSTVNILETLLQGDIVGTSKTVTFNSSGNPATIVHTKNGVTVRTDTFTWQTNAVTETRTLSSGVYITITTNLETLAQTISEVQEVE